MSPITTEKKKKFTYEDYLKTPDDQRFELIEGDLIMTPSPVPRHQRISREIGFRLHKFIAEHDLGEVFYAPCDIHLDKYNVLQPDIFFISKNRLSIIGEKNIQGAPDLVIEILSESTAYRDLVQKKRLYAQFGAREYWIVLPEEEHIEVYTLKGRTFEIHKDYEKRATLESPVLKRFKLLLKEIF
ncbi:MAG: Uma2 family endonuclease [Nitrospirae bacterium]|nr:Uma2 family endonuclease [Nitrospirota bacterium]